MAFTNVQGVCKLCLQPRILCKSHYLGRALHVLSRDDGKSAIVLTPKIITATPKQVWAHLLCAECEKRISRNGESYVLTLLNRKNSFTLLDLLNKTTPMKEEGALKVFSATDLGTDTDKLAYFALSIVWRGSVHDWKTIDGQTTGVPLGPYEERIRQYLAGEAGFPAGVLVAVHVCTDFGSHGMIYAPERVKGVRAIYSDFSFLVRGIWFHVYVGKDIPVDMKEICCVNSERKVIFLRSCEKEFAESGRHFQKTATISPKVAHLFKD
jgi:hypothetical protein